MIQPYFSIIIAVFNGGKTLSKALDSIANQTYKNIEVVIIDGGSTDDTLLIARQYHQVKYCVSEPDEGIYDAMNKGIQAAKGDWIYFLGSDDYLYENTVLEKVANFAQGCSCEMMYGNVLLNNKVYDGYFDHAKILRTNISHQAIFYKASVLEKLGLYNLKYKTHADWDLNIRCFFDDSIRAKYIDIVVAYFAIGGASSSHDVTCLREVVLPLRLNMLSGTSSLRSVKTYDEWWRLIRNSKTRSVNEVPELQLKNAWPIVHMIKFQSLFPLSMLRVGGLSKIFMVVGYCLLHIKLLFRWS